MDIGGMNRDSQNTTRCIGYNVVFPAFDFLPAVKARLLGGFRRTLDALTVDNPRAGLFGSTVFFRTARRIWAFTRSKNPVAIHFM